MFDRPLESDCLSNEGARKQVEMTALVLTSELVSDGDSGHDRTMYTDDIFRTLPPWLLQRYSMSQPDPHSTSVAADNIQAVIDSAQVIIRDRW